MVTRQQALDANLAHLVGEYRRGNWRAELRYSLTEGDAFVVRNQAHRLVTNPGHPENASARRRLEGVARERQAHRSASQS